MGKVIAVTGAAGYLGQRLIAYLGTRPWVQHIIALDVKPVPTSNLVIPYYFDMREASFLRAILAEHAVTHLIHAAFLTVQPPGMSERQMRAINVDGSRQVIHAALDHGVEHLLFVSSAAVYGSQRAIGIHENSELRPKLAYGRHKVEVERYLNDLRPRSRGTRFAVIRPAAIVGPRGYTLSHLRALTEQRFFVLVNGGKALTQALHEDDAVALLASVAEHHIEGTLNAAPNDYTSWADIGRLSELPLVSLPRPMLNLAARFNRVLPVLHGFTDEVVSLLSETLVLDNTSARHHTGWVPRHTTREAYAQMFGAPARELASA